MSTARRRILVVSDTLTLANNLLMWLREAGYDPAVVTSFNAGKEHLRTAPDILITELKLREYNGLHLALRAHRDGIPTAVIGADPRYAADAQEIGARYLAGDNVHRDDILLLVDGLLSARTLPPATAMEWTVNATADPGDEELAAAGDWREDAFADVDRLSSSPGRPVIH